MAKPWFLSKTIWFNFIMGLVAFAVEIINLLEHFEVLGAPAEYVALARTILTVVILIGNAILRVITKEPLALR
jgi:membrane protein CcdC involved in cytochrome C biogenesis